MFTLKFSEEEFDRIRDLGYEVVFNSEGEKSTLDKMTQEELDSFDVLVTYNSFEKLDILKMNNLKYIQLGSTGFDQVPVDKIVKKIFCYVIIKEDIVSQFQNGLYLPYYKYIKIQSLFMINKLENSGCVIF
ncbi:hypothetical protein [Terrisporobacter sp.]